MQPCIDLTFLLSNETFFTNKTFGSIIYHWAFPLSLAHSLCIMKSLPDRTKCLQCLTQQSWSVLSPLIGLVYLDPHGTRSGPEKCHVYCCCFVELNQWMNCSKSTSFIILYSDLTQMLLFALSVFTNNAKLDPIWYWTEPALDLKVRVLLVLKVRP